VEKTTNKCAICEGEIKTDAHGWSEGHNAEPVAKGRCCEQCNTYVVIPARLVQITAGVTPNENKR
tara:strand:+ start:3592 stop:3786 length:195 start_codon:yes stop_codon:yes gene_type:complete